MTLISTFSDSNFFLRILPIFVHEVTHKLAHEIYGSMMCAPGADSPFHDALRKDLKHLKETGFSQCHWKIASLLETASQYPEKAQPSEYLARIPQAAMILALHDNKTSTEIDTISRQSIPHLYEFYLSDFLKRCEKI